MSIAKKMWWLWGSGVSTPWYLAGGLIPESTNYTIYDPLAAADLATSYVNLANPGTRDATAPVAAPTHAQGTGWTFNGTTYLSSNTNLKTDSSVLIWVEGHVSGVYAFGASQSTPTRNFLFRPTSSSNRFYQKGSGGGNSLGALNGGIMALNNNAWIDGVDLGLYNNWSGANHTIPAFIGCENQSGTAANFWAGKVLRVAIYDFLLSAAQIEAVTDSMFDYQQAADNTYKNQVLALNPLSYYTGGQTRGSYLKDLSGNGANGEVYVATVGQSGQYGNALQGAGAATFPIARAVGDYGTLSGINLNNFWFSCWIYITLDASNQVRVLNIYSNTGAEYFALEVRTGNQCAVYCRENGVNQNTANVVIPTGQWVHLVGYNSLSTAKFGFYIDGVKSETVKTLTGFVDTTPDLIYPQWGMDLTGYIQHMAIFSGTPTQEQVDSLN